MIGSVPDERAPRVGVPVILGGAMLLAGIVYPVTGSALRHTTPLMIATVRALAGGVILTLALPLCRSRLPHTRRLWAWAALIGFGNTTLTQIGISEGTHWAGAAVAAVLSNSSPFFVALFGRLVLAERIAPLRGIGLVVGFAGVLAVVFADPGSVAHGSQLVIGFGLALAGALGWAAGGIGMRALTQREPHLDIIGMTAAQFLAGSVPLLLLLPFSSGATSWTDPALVASLVYLVIGGQVLVYLGFNAALAAWDSTRVYAWTFLVPVVAVVIEAVRGNLPGVGSTIGILLVIIGVGLVNHPRAQPVEEPAAASATAR
jgi:drug/metabolite transporter (DMT)-like permease